MMPSGLPIEAVYEELAAAYQAGGLMILEAPTGSGKSTQVPQWVSTWWDGLVLVLEPRRVAARLLARRVAEERGGRVGDEVGYHVRFERKAGPGTRVLFVTDGMLLRRMLNDPDLEGVSAVLFDEFHERHLESDLALSLLRERQRKSRPDLRLLVMSATLDRQALEQSLAPCQFVHAEGRTYPVDIRYLSRPLDPRKTPVWEAAASACADLLREQADGNILVFMPGRREIQKTVDACRVLKLNSVLQIYGLHGDLSLDEQARILQDTGRKLIVATNLAESSLTVDGVSGVVDSGWVRMARFDAGRKMDTLHVLPISQASADQRAGRAGRTRAGVCVRLWTEQGQQGRSPQTDPEIHRCDLAPSLLQVGSILDQSVDALPWFEAPREERLTQAIELLHQLKALTPDHHINALGRDLAALPVHPRYARLLLHARDAGALEDAVLMAALNQAGRILPSVRDWTMKRQRERKLTAESEADLFQDMEAFFVAESNRWNSGAVKDLRIQMSVARQADRIRQQLMRSFSAADRKPQGTAEERRQALLEGLFLSFADQLARPVREGSRRYQLAGGREVELDEHSTVRGQSWLVAVGVTEIGTLEGHATPRITSASAVREEWIEREFAEDIRSGSESFYDAGMRRVVRRTGRSLFGLDLESTVSEETDADRAAPVLAKAWTEGQWTLHSWNEEVERWIRRCNLLASLFPEYGISPIDDAGRESIIEQFVYGAFRVKQLKDRSLMPVLKSWLSPELQAALDQWLPDRFVFPGGYKRRLDYREDGRVVLSSALQDFFGMKTSPVLAEGRQLVVVELLAPNRRAVQTTQDLARFWTEHYPSIRTQLSRRYPRHAWPEHP